MTATTVLVTVAAAGTPARVTTDESILAAAIHVQPFWSNGGASWVGLAGLNKTTGAAVIRRFATATEAPFLLQHGSGANVIQVANYYVDVASNGEKMLITFWRS